MTAPGPPRLGGRPGGRSLGCHAASLGLAALLMASLACPAAAEEWGTIEPGVTTQAKVRERWEAPSKETRLKVEGYDTAQWVYEEARAPGGLIRMTVDFGLLTAAGYKADVVRLLTLEPRRAIFGKGTVIQAFGQPDGIKGRPETDLTFFYESGLLVYFDKEDFAHRMVFSIPQKGPPAPAQGQAPPPGAPGQRRGAPAPAPGAPSPAPPPGAGGTPRR